MPKAERLLVLSIIFLALFVIVAHSLLVKADYNYGQGMGANVGLGVNSNSDNFNNSENANVVIATNSGDNNNEVEIHDNQTNRTMMFNAVHSEDTERIKNGLQERNHLGFNSSQIPDNCTVTGVVLRCNLNGSRTMIVFAGKSGNVIIQVKGVNASTQVQLYKDINGTLYGVFNNNETKIINLLPDQIQALIMQETNATISSDNITNIDLNNEGQYEVHASKDAKFIGLFKVHEGVSWTVDPENASVSGEHKPWYGFLIAETKTPNVLGASCGTVTPGQNDACCQSRGFDFWNSTSQRCGFNLTN